MKMNGNGNGNGNGGGGGGPVQTIRIEQAPIKIIAESPKKSETYKL